MVNLVQCLKEKKNRNTLHEVLQMKEYKDYVPHIRLVLPDKSKPRKRKNLVSPFDYSGLKWKDNCELGAFHELLHLKQYYLKFLTKNGIDRFNTDSPDFNSREKVESTSRNLEECAIKCYTVAFPKKPYSQAWNLYGGTTSRSKKSKQEIAFIVSRIQYLRSPSCRDGGEAPTVVPELIKYINADKKRDEVYYPLTTFLVQLNSHMKRADRS